MGKTVRQDPEKAVKTAEKPAEDSKKGGKTARKPTQREILDLILSEGLM